MRKHWAGCIVGLVVGWRLAMVYPLDDEMPSVLLALGVGTLGVAIVAVVAYCAGWVDGSDRSQVARGDGGGAGGRLA